MRKAILLTVLSICTLAIPCEASVLKRMWNCWKLKYYFVAQNDANCEIFYGLIQDNPLIGRASIDFVSPTDGCNCHGVGQVTDFPPGGGVVGQRGYIKVKCSDGRTMRGNFVTTSLTTGFASVDDSNGNHYVSTFGHRADQAITRANAIRRTLNCSECTSEAVVLEVKAQILSK